MPSSGMRPGTGAAVASAAEAAGCTRIVTRNLAGFSRGRFGHGGSRGLEDRTPMGKGQRAPADHHLGLLAAELRRRSQYGDLARLPRSGEKCFRLRVYSGSCRR